jgi:hypothetical protein
VHFEEVGAFGKPRVGAEVEGDEAADDEERERLQAEGFEFLGEEGVLGGAGTGACSAAGLGVGRGGPGVGELLDGGDRGDQGLLLGVHRFER